MEHGFFHPDRGYWQTIEDVPPDILATYPVGTVEVPLRPAAGATWSGSEWLSPPPVETLPTLTPGQWDFFLDLTGFRVTLEAALTALPKTTLEERAAWAGLKAVIYSSTFYELPVILAITAQVRAMGLAITIPTDAEIIEAFHVAAAFNGVQTVLNAGAPS